MSHSTHRAIRILAGIGVFMALWLPVTAAAQAPVTGYFEGSTSQIPLERARALAPGNYAVSYFLGNVYLRQGREDQAIVEWQRYLERAPRDSRSVSVNERLTVLKVAQARRLAREGADPQGEVPGNTLAVLNFRNLGTADFAPLVKGLTAMVISDLSKVPDLKVVERVRMQALVDEMQLGQVSGLVDSDTVARAGRMLQARRVAQGEVDVPAADQIRIFSEITETVEQTKLGESETAGMLGDLFRLQKQIVFGILEHVGIRENQLAPEVVSQIRKTHTTSIQAIIAFGQGLDLMDRGDFAGAKDAFQKALQLDPGFELAAQVEEATPEMNLTPEDLTAGVDQEVLAPGGEDEEDSVLVGGGPAAGPSGAGGASDAGAATDTGTVATSSLAVLDVADVTVEASQQETEETTEAQEQTRSLSRDMGLAVGALAKNGSFHNFHFSRSLVDGDAPSFEIPGYRDYSQIGLLRLNGSVEPAEIIYLDINGKEASQGLPAAITDDVTLAGNDYAEWGYWRQPNAMIYVPEAESWTFTEIGYWAGGEHTLADQLSSLASTGTRALYSGSVWAHHSAQDPTGQLSGGTFSFQVDFATSYITAFDLLVDDGTYKVEIWNARGAFDPSGFTLDPWTGYWGIDDYPARGPHELSGAFFGPSAQSTAGIFYMIDRDKHVQGVFGGSTTSGSYDASRAVFPAGSGGVMNGIIRSPSETVAGYLRPEMVVADIKADSYSLSTFDLYGTADNSSNGTTSFSGSYPSGQLTSVYIDGRALTGGLPHYIGRSVRGATEFLDYGIWLSETDMTYTPASGPEETYRYTYRGWFVTGDPTTETEYASLASSSVTAVFSGDIVQAKHAQQASGTDMRNGSVSFQVDFNSGLVSDFDLSVSGNGHSAGIQYGSGEITAADGLFRLDTSSGEWTVDGNVGIEKDLTGTFFESTAPAAGGVFFIGTISQDNWVHGLFAAGRDATDAYETSMEYPTAVHGGTSGLLINGMFYDGSFGRSLENVHYTESPYDINFFNSSGTSWSAAAYNDSGAYGSSQGEGNTLTRATYGSPAETEVLPPGTNPISSVEELDHNEFLTWGKWRDPDAMSSDYFFDGVGYFMQGDLATSDTMTNLASQGVVATYSGTAYGTHSTEPATMMTGDFNATVDFGASQVTDFDWQVQSANHSAAILNASGQVSSNTFQVAFDAANPTANGQWNIDGSNTPARADVRGAFFGHQAQAAAGVVSLNAQYPDGSVWGMFQGKRP